MSYQNYHTTVLWHTYNKASITTNFYKLLFMFCDVQAASKLPNYSSVLHGHFTANVKATISLCLSLKRFLPFSQPWALTLPPLPIKSTFPPLSVLGSFITHFYKNAFQDTWCFILLPTLLLSFKSLK